MRPKSIVMFERLFLASLAMGLFVLALGYEDMMAALANEPTFQKAGVGAGFVIGLLAVVYAVYLLLWYLTARQGVNAAKWIVVVLTVLDALAALRALAGPWDAMLLLSLAARALAVAAVVYLFQPDAVAWLTRAKQGDEAADPATSD